MRAAAAGAGAGVKRHRPTGIEDVERLIAPDSAESEMLLVNRAFVRDLLRYVRRLEVEVDQGSF